MSINMQSYRKVYAKASLDESDVLESPISQFIVWLKEAEESKTIEEVNAMTITTVNAEGRPKSRVVLLKQVSQEGFEFYTNYKSNKAKDIAENPQVCLSFFWPSLERQIHIVGRAEKLSEEASKAYFNSRPKGSQLGAWVSPQSEPIPNRKFLEDRLSVLEVDYADKDEVPKPDFWGGYLVKAFEIEFWQGRPNRLHDRIVYKRTENETWTINRLAP